MPHILILDEWTGITSQMNGYAEQIATNLANNEYEDKALTEANAIQSETAALFNTIDSSHRVTADDLVGRMETLLGI